jgi:hypothetical protein
LILRERLQQLAGEVMLGLEQGSSVLKLVGRQVSAGAAKSDSGCVKGRVPA